jgi:P27 family predicted phage terminase small subunit
MRGRKPKPTETKKRAGNPGRRKLAGDEPKPKTTKIAPTLIDKRAREFAASVLPELRTTKVFTDVDMGAFEMMCTHYAIARLAAERVTKEGLMQHNAFGWAKHPLLQVWRDNSKAFQSYAAEFGMTPSARTRIHIEEGEQLSLADMLFGDVDVKAEKSA